MTLLLRRVRLADGAIVDVRIVGETIAEVLAAAPDDRGSDGGEPGASDDVVVDLDGALLLPALSEPHAHLDKAFLAEVIPNPTGDLMGAIEAMHSHRHLITAADTRER